jgi:hypothetical protein
MADEVQLHRGRGRPPKQTPQIITLNSGRRAIKVIAGGKVRLYPIEQYAVVNHRRMEDVLGRMTQPEIRRALDLEWGSPTKRRAILLRMTDVLFSQQKREALEVIRKNVPAQLPRQGRRHTLAQMESAAMATFGPATQGRTKGKPRRKGGSSYRSTLTKRMRERRAEYEREAIDRMKADGRTKLSKAERLELKRKSGDHFHDGMTAGELCELCGEIVEEQLSW